MGFHEKGRSLMKKQEFENALCHLLQADHHFRCVAAPVSLPYLQAPPTNACVCVWWMVSSKCGSALLRSVDNFAVLQLDIVWCYRALKALTCLDDARKRLQSAEDCFLQCYGQQQQRLLMIKVRTCTRPPPHALPPASRQPHHSTVSPGQHRQGGRPVSAALPPPESPGLHRRKRLSG